MMANYDSASLPANTAFMSMYDTTLAIQQGQDARAPELEGVYAREAERVEALEAEAARERVKWGWIKAVGTVVTIAVGVIVVVASAGTATPLVVVGAAGLMTAFGASNLVEAAGDIRLGNMGDATTQAFNPLRDTVFQGNQTLYDVVDFAVCAVGTAGIPIAQAAKAGTLARGSVAFAVGREAVEDLAMQKAIQLGTPYLGPEAAMAAAVVAGGAAGRRGGGAETRGIHTPSPHAIDPSYNPSIEWGAAFFDRTILGHYLKSDATLGRPGDVMFHMPLTDALPLTSPGSVYRGTGAAPSIERAIKDGGFDGAEIFGVIFPRDGMDVRVPTSVDSKGHPHYLPGGQTALQTEGGGMLLNSTREFVVDGGMPLPSGTIIFQQLPDGTRQILRMVE